MPPRRDGGRELRSHRAFSLPASRTKAYVWSQQPGRLWFDRIGTPPRGRHAAGMSSSPVSWYLRSLLTASTAVSVFRRRILVRSFPPPYVRLEHSASCGRHRLSFCSDYLAVARSYACPSRIFKLPEGTGSPLLQNVGGQIVGLLVVLDSGVSWSPTYAERGLSVMYFPAVCVDSPAGGWGRGCVR